MAQVMSLRLAACSRLHLSSTTICRQPLRITLCQPARSSPVVRAAMSTEASGADAPRNVLGGPLGCCCTSPKTGYYRDGYCRTDASDHGRHVICSQVSQEFLTYSKSRGNDLMTPSPGFGFPGLKPGDKWCLCASRWKEAYDAGVAPPIFLACTHAKALEYVTLDQLKQHAVDLEQCAAGAAQ